MRRILCPLSLVILLPLIVAAQKIDKPKLAAQAPTAAQEALIREGMDLFDQRKFDEAITKFEQVLKESPDLPAAMYELAMAHYNKGDRVHADEVARKGAQYKSEYVPLFYTIIGNVLDDNGKSAEAIEVYKDSVKLLRENKAGARHLAEASFNLGVAYARLKKYPESRTALKEGLEANFSHVSSHFVLAQIYAGTGYKIPGFLAAARFLGLERNTSRTRVAAETILGILKPAQKDEKTGNINIFMNLNAPKDEGDFGFMDLILGTVTTVRGDDDKNKTDAEMFVDGMGTVIAILSENKKMRTGFVGTKYIPYVEALKNAGHHQALAYVVLQQGGNPEAVKWINANPDKVQAYFDWAKGYKPSE
jgi:tetratricopeptide (TPR) repeat protein